MKRFALVEKSGSEVGDGTAFPMLVTLDQLAEIMYRVKDARCIEGSAVSREYYEVGEVFEYYTGSMEFTGVTPSTALVEFDGSDPYTGVAYTSRGWCTVLSEESPAVPMTDYGSAYFSETTYLTTPSDIFGDYPIAFREAVAERAMWADRGVYDFTETLSTFLEDAGTAGSGILKISSTDFRTGFSCRSSSWADDSTGYVPSIYAPTNTVEDSLGGGSAVPYRFAGVELQFSGLVAWVDTNGSENPFDPANELYVGVRLYLLHSINGPDGRFSTDEDWLAGSGSTVDTGGLLKLKLSGSGNFATAKIYGIEEAEASPGYLAFESCSDWVFEATEWWPYAKPGGPVWNSATGAKL